MERWERAVEAQMDVWKFWNSDGGQRFAHGYHRSVSSKYPREGKLTQSLADMQRLVLALADPMYVSDDMFDLCEHAVASFRPEPLLETDLITRAGFVLLPRPFLGVDRLGKTCAYRAFSWYPAAAPDAGETIGVLADEPRPIGGVVLSLYSHADDMHLDDYGKELGATTVPQWILLHVTPWMFNEQVPKGDGPKAANAGWWTQIQGFLRLSMQYVSTRERRDDLPRSTRRRMKREQWEPRGVVVVRLRRPKHKPSGAPREVDWKERWIVGDHWRDQWYPSLNAHRQIWIAPYVKGPEDKPLAIRKGRVFEVVR